MGRRSLVLLVGIALYAFGQIHGRRTLVGGRYLVRNVEGIGEWYVFGGQGKIIQTTGLRYEARGDSLIVLSIDYRWRDHVRHDRTTRVVYGPDWKVMEFESIEGKTRISGLRRGANMSLTFEDGELFHARKASIAVDQNFVIGLTMWPRLAVSGVLTEGGEQDVIQLDLATMALRQLNINVGKRHQCAPGTERGGPIECYDVLVNGDQTNVSGTVDITGLPITLERGGIRMERADMAPMRRWVARGGKEGLGELTAEEHVGSGKHARQ